MNLLILTLAVPLVIAALGGFVGSRRFKEIVMVGGLALTFILCLLTAFEFLGGTVHLLIKVEYGAYTRDEFHI